MSKNLGDIYTKPLKDRAGPTSPHLPFLQSLVSFSPASLRTRASLDFNPSFFFSDSSGSFSGGLVGSSLPGALLFLRVIPSGSSLMGLRTQWALSFPFRLLDSRAAAALPSNSPMTKHTSSQLGLLVFFQIPDLM